ncbi:ABC transporter ATP-binding protein [Neopusillimonas maritima]|uniref:Branched-chain amino acid ABC transporter ATP-binding protein n=1 Tax=Neopusillimonas maritima TaxID=2026239 RepID=A0ABX9MW51_9BURK|nr:ABC transporter ATP-binding protein [Neopusillimonas maritima]MBF22980.1 branched-chain amino acid ABC transporter ATP-binding protein [Pusillimonas sp.]RII83143.1 branched-chain amino acid ABC transporter ATP-binding protein [Neopusillimonas maritima]|tara:strand:- start:150992 stop:151738 length:747 start_codon:yes stop_codon:yes gene_type:complete
MTEALKIENLCRNFGALQVTDDVSFCLEKGARVALIGPNGAGKTTLVNLIAGSLSPSSGRIYLHQQDITHMAQAARVHSGLVRTFQVTRLFNELTVEDNIRMAIVQHHKQSFRLFSPLRKLANLDSELQHVVDMMQLNDVARRHVRNLAYGEQRLVEIAMALALKPRVLLLDEPAAGVPQSESDVVMRAISELPEEIAILFIEHDMDLVFRFAHRILVLVSGALLLDDTPEAVAADERVHKLYLGEAA